MIDAIKRAAASGKPVTRDDVRDAILTAKVPTIQGTWRSMPTAIWRTARSACSRSRRIQQAADDVSAQYQYRRRASVVS